MLIEWIHHHFQAANNWNWTRFHWSCTYRSTSCHHVRIACVHGPNLIHNSRCALSSWLPSKSKPGWHIWKIKYQVKSVVRALDPCSAVQQSAQFRPLMCFYTMMSPTYISNDICALVAMHWRWVYYNTTVGWISRHVGDDNTGRSPILIQTTYAWTGLIQHYHSLGCVHRLFIGLFSHCMHLPAFLLIFAAFPWPGWPFVAIKTILQFNVSEEMTWRISYVFF